MILLVGLDGYDYAWRAPLEERGYHVLPMDSPYALSGPAWTSIWSGLRPETHGVQHVPTADMLAEGFGKPRPRWLWDHFAATGKVSVVVNAPFTYPPGLANRLLVCGYPTIKGHTYPRSAEPGWPIAMLDLSYAFEDMSLPQMFGMADDDLIRAASDGRWALGHEFVTAVADGACDLAILCLTDFDRLAHYAYRTFRQTHRREQVIDEVMLLLERLETRFYPEWMLVVSDHGLDLTEEPREGDGWALCHGPVRPASHTGVFAYKGEAARPMPNAVMQLFDVAPTVMWLADIVPSGPIEGTALTGIAGCQDLEDQAIMEQLQGLGYVA